MLEVKNIGIENSGQYVDVIAHSCNCFCVQGKGAAKALNNKFNTLSYRLEQPKFKGDYNKLGNIEGKEFYLDNDYNLTDESNSFKKIYVFNMYSQYNYGIASPYSGIPLDYSALKLCFQKLDKIFINKIIGLPYKISCNNAKGNWSVVKEIIDNSFKNNKVILFKPD